MSVVADPHHLSVPPPQLHRRNREPVDTGLPPTHDEHFCVHTRQGQLPLPRQGAVVAKVGCGSGLCDTHKYRRALLKNSPRHLGVLNLAVEKAGWDRRPPEGRARGVAVHAAFGSFAAQVAEASVENGRIRVHRVVCAIDCGTVVNPETIAAQMESGIAFGLSAALYSALHFKDGRVQESNYHDYRVLRLNEMPVVELHIVPSTEKPGGVGEVAVPHIAPAVANAVARLTGQRLRELPLRLHA